MSGSTYWVAVTVIHETPAAWLLHDGIEHHWVPKSQVLDSEDDLGVGVQTSIELPEWLAEEKGMLA